MPGEIEKELNKGIQKFGVFSMCEENNNHLMWSHYADKHQGFCLEFEQINNNILGNPKVTKAIKYTNKYPILTTKNFRTKTNNEGKLEKFDIQNFPAYTKSYTWRLEKEWRILLIRQLNRASMQHTQFLDV